MRFSGVFFWKKTFLFLCFFIPLLGLFFLFNASGTYAFENFGNSYYFLINQSFWLVTGFIFFFLVQKVPYNLLKKFSFFLYLFGVFLLFFILIPTPFSLKVYGARRWFLLNPSFLPEIPILGRLSFQPSELIKFSLILFLPQIFYSSKFKEASDKQLYVYLVYLLIPAFFVFLEPDLKNTLLLILIGFSILFASGYPLKFFIYIIPISVLLLSIFVLSSSYRRARLKTFLGGGDAQKSAYHVRQIKIALGSGGITGLGLGQSRQKNNYLPEVVGDSLFAIIGEELGFIGSSFTILLFFIILYSLYKGLTYVDNPEKQLTLVGIMVWFGFQVFLNLGAISGVIPLTGVPLPLVSYGGSSVIFTLASLGVAYRFFNEV